jgi:hypothetical protein
LKNGPLANFNPKIILFGTTSFWKVARNDAGERGHCRTVRSCSLDVCLNQRIHCHKVFAGLAARGHTSMGWFFGFKPHLMLLSDRLLLRRRAIIETISDQLKNISQIEHSRHRSVLIFLSMCCVV